MIPAYIMDTGMRAFSDRRYETEITDQNHWTAALWSGTFAQSVFVRSQIWRFRNRLEVQFLNTCFDKVFWQNVV